MGAEIESCKIKISDPDVATTELCYTTAVDMKARSFFGQLCKYSNEELEQFNCTINQYCMKAQERGNDGTNLAKVELDDVIGSKFLGVWYRAKVVDFKKRGKICRVKYIDYGNIRDVDPAELVQFNKNEIPIVDKPSYGMTYYVESAKDYDEHQFTKLSECLLSSYIMVKILDRDGNGGLKVSIPRNGYNRGVWRSLYDKLEGCENDNSESEKSDSS